MKLNKNNKSNYLEVLYLFLISLTPLFWFKDRSQILLGHDSGFRPDGLLHIYNTFFSWSPIANFGFDWTLFKGFLITQAPEAIFTKLFNSLHYGEIATFIFWFFVMALSMYIFVRNLFPDKKYFILRLFASTFYVYNFFLLQGWFIAERAKFSLFAALPLGLLIIYKTLNKELSIVKGSVLFGLVFFLLNGGGFPSLYGGVLLVYLITFIYLTVANYLKTGIKAVLDSLITGVSFLISLVLLNSYWLLPQYYVAKTTYSTGLGAQGGIEGILAWEAVISKYASFLNLLRLQGIPDWYNNTLHPYANEFLTNPILIIGSFVPVAVIILGMFFKRRHKETKDVKAEKIINLMFAIFFAGLIFTAGSHPPTGKFYTLLIQYLPGFPIFRSGLYKFGPALWLSMIFLSSYYLNFLINNFVKKKDQILQLFVLSVILLLAYHYPFFRGNFFDWNKPFTTKVTPPTYVYDTAKFISDNVSNTSRILLLPELHPYYKSDGYSWGFWSVWPLPYTVSPKSFVSNDSAGDQKISEAIYTANNKNNSDLLNKLVGMTGIDKVLWRGDAVYINKPVEATDLINQKNSLEKNVIVEHVKNFGKWNFYSLNNPYYVPLVYSPVQIGYLNSDSALVNVLKTVNVKPRFATAYGSPKLIDFSNSEIVEANCNFCEDGSFKKLQDEIKIPNSQLLPDSLFIPINNLKEKLLLSNIKKLDSAKKIDAYLTLSNNKFSQDITLFKKGQNERTVKLHSQIFNQYKDAISNAVVNSSSLSEQSRNYYLIKISAYLETHKKNLMLNQGVFSDEGFNEVYVFIVNELKQIEPKLWISDETHKKYEFNINNPADYDLNISKYIIVPERVFIDGKSVEINSRVSLSKGYHRAEIDYANFENQLDGVASDFPLKFKFNDSYSYKIKNFDPNSKYLIKMDYLRLAGKFGVPVQIIQWKDKVGGEIINKIELGLDTSDFEDSISYELIPEPGAGAVSVIISQPHFTGDETVMEIKNLSAKKIIDPKMFFTRITNPENLIVPKIKFERVNPTKYIAHIDNAQKPFVLIFGESFSPAWKVYYPQQSIFRKTGQQSSYFDGWINDYTAKDYIVDPFLATRITGSVVEANHFKANGYSNGWYIDKTGSYDLIIEYKPQRLVYIGMLISAVSVGVCLIYLIVKKMKNEKN